MKLDKSWKGLQNFRGRPHDRPRDRVDGSSKAKSMRGLRSGSPWGDERCDALGGEYRLCSIKSGIALGWIETKVGKANKRSILGISCICPLSKMSNKFGKPSKQSASRLKKQRCFKNNLQMNEL
jgi:hypothetical protein